SAQLRTLPIPEPRPQTLSTLPWPFSFHTTAKVLGSFCLHERSWIVFIPLHDRVGGHVGQGLDRKCRVETAHRWERRATDDEEVRNVPTLAVTVHDGSPRITSHSRPPFVVRARRTGVHD